MQHRFFAGIMWQDVYEKKVGGAWPPRGHDPRQGLTKDSSSSGQGWG